MIFDLFIQSDSWPHAIVAIFLILPIIIVVAAPLFDKKEHSLRRPFPSNESSEHHYNDESAK